MGDTTLPATERILSERASLALYQHGLLPITTLRNSDAILVGA